MHRRVATGENVIANTFKLSRTVTDWCVERSDHTGMLTDAYFARIPAMARRRRQGCSWCTIDICSNQCNRRVLRFYALQYYSAMDGFEEEHVLRQALPVTMRACTAPRWHDGASS